MFVDYIYIYFFLFVDVWDLHVLVDAELRGTKQEKKVETTQVPDIWSSCNLTWQWRNLLQK